jgi:hypothetical protein
MSAIPIAPTATDLAKGMSMFAIDESLAALVEAAAEEADSNNGEVSEELKNALATYAEAFGYKVDRIADYLKAQKAEAEVAQREAERFQARYKAAETREKRLKQMLAWFMVTRNVQKLRGAMNTISLQANSTPSLVIQETTHIPDNFYRARIDLSWPEWHEILGPLPPSGLRDRLRDAEGRNVQKELQRGILADALGRGEAIPGVSLVKGSHVRLR